MIESQTNMPTHKTYVIAEAGVNHNGNADMAFQLVDAAAAAGADAVKFQTFKAEKLVTKTAGKAAYQQQATNAEESQFAMLKQLELAHHVYSELAIHCKKQGITFLSTAFDGESLRFLVQEIGLNTLKFPSGELSNGPLLLAHAQTGCELIVSTGMATLADIEQALGVIAYGLLNDQQRTDGPSHSAFQAAYLSSAGQQLLKEKVTLLHCTTEYPAPVTEINLCAMSTMRAAFGLRVGYSDHSAGINIPIAATAMGAELIEKHFTLDKELPGPDHQASLSPKELTAMVAAIRDVEQAIGQGVKGPTISELKNRDVARKSLVAAQPIRAGEYFSESNVTIKRPGTGMNPMQYWDLLGQQATRDFEEDEQITHGYESTVPSDRNA